MPQSVIPDEFTEGERDPETRIYKRYQYVMDPGSRPASRDLAGMTNYDTVSKAGHAVKH